MNLFDTIGETYTDTRQADEHIVALLVEYLHLSHGATVADIVPFPLPPDLRDNFAAAAWQNPKRYLEERYRGNISSFQKADPSAVRQGIARLAEDLASGAPLPHTFTR
jgi:hypothetical protein